MMKLTIIGLGNQAKSWALNLKDSGISVRVALRPGSPSKKIALNLNLEVVEIGDDNFFSAGHSYALLTPDSSHLHLLEEFAPKLPPSTIILYAHGFSVLKHHLPHLFPHLNHVLFAPKCIGSELRNQFLQKGPLGAVYSLEYVPKLRDEIDLWIKKLSEALGITLGPFETTFEKETMADLYSEQGLLCSIIPYTASIMVENLIQEGVEPELAYLECWHELKLIVNAMVEKGPLAFFEMISPNALLGSEKGYQRLFSPELKLNLQSLLKEIKNQNFNAELDSADFGKLKSNIQNRWHESSLQKAFIKMNQEKK